MNMENNLSIARWLFAVCALLLAMITIGAITRLTESGLSITQWHVMSDMWPPIGTAAWQEKFAQYQQSPEYRQINRGMSMDDFQLIYFWEWLHRLLGRVIGLAYALPLLYFWLRKKIPSRDKPAFLLYLGLGALQGAIGWYMVKSGLINEPRVSHFRLALHLGTAFLLLLLLWRQALRMWPRARMVIDTFVFPIPFCIRRQYYIGFVLLAVTMCWGAFTAGLDAGLACSDFPKTCAQWLPQELFFQNAFWRNIVHEPTAVQFCHRVLGTVTFLILFVLGIRLIRTRHAQLRKLGLSLHLLILLQWILGVGTIQSHVLLPLAAAHQFVAVLNLLVMVTLLPFMRRASRIS